MHPNLQLVQALCKSCQEYRGEGREPGHLSDMDIIVYQAMLMDEGADLFRAFKSGEMASVLAGFVNLAYSALQVLAELKQDVSGEPPVWHNDGSILTIVNRVGQVIALCSDGKAAAYSQLYMLCERLARDFLNADFDRAFQAVHSSRMSELQYLKMPPSKHFKTPDLSDYLFE